MVSESWEANEINPIVFIDKTLRRSLQSMARNRRILAKLKCLSQWKQLSWKSGKKKAVGILKLSSRKESTTQRELSIYTEVCLQYSFEDGSVQISER